MLNAAEIKKTAFSLGADLCGIAPIDRFKGVPEGFHPCDVLPSCKSVIVFARKFPVGVLLCDTKIPYTIARNIICEDLDLIAVKFCAAMEQNGILAVPTGTVSHTRLDPKTGRFHGTVSAKHCAVAAGLGRIGKNTLLVTPEYGNMVWLTTVLADASPEPDAVLPGSPCPEDCSICIDNCPVQALGDPEMNQAACRQYAFKTEPGEQFVFNCYKCRALCPNCFGSKNRRI